MNYPEWSLFPRHLSAPQWVEDFVAVLQQNYKVINSENHNKFESDEVLKVLEKDLENVGWKVETGKKDAQKYFVQSYTAITVKRESVMKLMAGILNIK